MERYNQIESLVHKICKLSGRLHLATMGYSQAIKEEN
jgi:hypothetical protein